MLSACDLGISPLEQGIIEGENPVFESECFTAYEHVHESSCLGLQL